MGTTYLFSFISSFISSFMKDAWGYGSGAGFIAAHLSSGGGKSLTIDWVTDVGVSLGSEITSSAGLMGLISGSIIDPIVSGGL